LQKVLFGGILYTTTVESGGAGFVIGGGFQTISAGQKRGVLALNAVIGFGLPREFSLTPW
jgi:hypothetical protein